MSKPSIPGYWWVRFKTSDNTGWNWQKKIAFVESVDKETVKLLSNPEDSFYIEQFDWLEPIATGVKTG